MEKITDNDHLSVWQNEIYFEGHDGVKLFARETGNRETRKRETGNDITLLCLHGLTRNSLDFEPMAQRLPQYHIIAPDQRGRGRSAYDPNPAHYDINFYVRDMFELIRQRELRNIILVGTSMGGLMSMVMAALKPRLFRGIILNDVGPELDPAGLERIKQYLGKGTPASSWEEAADQVRKINSDYFPDFKQQDWMDFARRTYISDDNGRPAPAYDNNIAKVFETQNVRSGIGGKIIGLKNRISATLKRLILGDMWRLFGRLKKIPILTIRGETSDILSRKTVQRMAQIHPSFSHITVPGRGHAPLLDEDEALSAMDRFIKK